MPLTLGEPAPWFRAQTPAMPDFTFDSVAGRFILLAFLPVEREARQQMVQALAAQRALFDDARLSAFVISRDVEAIASAPDMRGLRWIPDSGGAITGQFGLPGDADELSRAWLLLDPTLRVLTWAAMSGTESLFRRLGALPAPGDHAGVTLSAPVLMAPRIFEPELCQQLIALHQTGETTFTGVMRDAGDRTAYVMDELKKRRDLQVTNPDLQAALRERLEQRLFPLIKLSLGFTVTRIERFLVSCYSADDGGVFHAHRDNTTHATAHRAFACSLNLNDDYVGGAVRFPEFGATTYRPPAGGAVVFSCGLLHEATRVTEGRRYAFLPFFYDEAGESVLQAYRARATAAV
jgi:predicted 2-oxoglutarate/Fe(II)-dependent dioxygenase YbiX